MKAAVFTGVGNLLEIREIPEPKLAEGEALVEIAGCGVCHTDLGFYYDGVPTVTKPPLTLGHEISGVVIKGPDDWVGKEVIIPAVMPCNRCAICEMGRGNRCLAQKMPGNSLGRYGGFATHIPVPYEELCVIEDRKGFPLSHLAVIADAITTPYQAATRAELHEGDRVIVVGATGGVGTYMTQIAGALGATVVAIDINDQKLQQTLDYGASHTINSKEKAPKSVKSEFKVCCKENGLPHNFGWKIFECSGTKTGQEMALEMLSFVGKLILIGYTTAKVEFMLSRLMAFDAEIFGTWGCPPKHYPTVLDMVLKGRIALEPFIETRPLSQIQAVFEQAHAGKLTKRVILEPDL